MGEKKRREGLRVMIVVHTENIRRNILTNSHKHAQRSLAVFAWSRRDFVKEMYEGGG